MKHATSLLCLALVGCVGYDLVGLPTHEATRAEVFMASQQADSVEIRVYAVFRLGRDSAGRLVSLGDTAITVDGRRIIREALTAPGPVGWFFSWQSGRIQSASIENIAVDIPPLAHTPGTDVSLEIPRAARIGEYVVPLPVIGDLRLPISAPEIRPGGDATGAHWSTSIGDACTGGTRQYGVASGTGWFPHEVWIPRTMIDAMGSTDFAVCFSSGMSYLLDDAPYEIQVGTMSSIEWRVRR